MTSTFSTISGFPEMPEMPKYEIERAIDNLDNQSLFNMWHDNADAVVPINKQEDFIGAKVEVWWSNQTARYRNDNLKEKYREDLRQYEFNKKIQHFKETKEYERKKAEKKRLRMSYTPETEKKLMAPDAPEKKPTRRRRISEKDDLMNYTESITGILPCYYVNLAFQHSVNA